MGYDGGNEPPKRGGPNKHADDSGGCSRFGAVRGARRVFRTRDRLPGCPVEGLASVVLRGPRQIEYESALPLHSTCLRSARCQSAGRVSCCIRSRKCCPWPGSGVFRPSRARRASDKEPVAEAVKKGTTTSGRHCGQVLGLVG